MTNKLYVSLVLRATTTKSLYINVHSSITINATRKGNDKEKCTLVLKNTNALNDSQFTYLCFKYGNYKDYDNYSEIRFSKVQARLYQGENRYGKYYYIKVFLSEHIIITHFFTNDEVTIIDKFIDLKCDFSLDRKELVEFEESIVELI